METKYTYHALGFVNLTSFAFRESYLIPGILDSFNEVIVIGVLSQGENFNKQKDLDAILRISRPAVTMLTTQMIQKGLITQKPNPDDQRGYILVLTPFGKKIAAWIIYRTKMINHIQLKGFTKEEIKTYNRLSLKMAENILDISEREMLKLPKFDSTQSVNESTQESVDSSFISEEDRRLLIKLERNTKKLLKKQIIGE